MQSSCRSCVCHLFLLVPQNPKQKGVLLCPLPYLLQECQGTRSRLTPPTSRRLRHIAPHARKLTLRGGYHSRFPAPGGPQLPIKSYLTQVKEQGFALASICQQVCALKMFGRWLKRTGREVWDIDEAVTAYERICEGRGHRGCGRPRGGRAGVLGGWGVRRVPADRSVRAPACVPVRLASVRVARRRGRIDSSRRAGVAPAPTRPRWSGGSSARAARPPFPTPA